MNGMSLRLRCLHRECSTLRFARTLAASPGERGDQGRLAKLTDRRARPPA
jgi:hypothetical protein